MSLGDSFSRIYDIFFREFPHRAETGLFSIGNPQKSSPVLLTGNYTETVRRLKKVLKGENVWLLVANSKGINVWCAAGGGHLTHHDVISAIVTSGAEEKMLNHTLILPQLGATGIERQKITEATGWKTVWGPARLDDLPIFLKQGHMATPSQRFMRFPLWDRMEMATLWGIPMIVLGFVIFTVFGGWNVGVSVSVEAAFISYSIFAALPRLNIKGKGRWIRFAGFAAMATLIGWLFLYSIKAMTTGSMILAGIGGVIETLVLSVDIAGTTPWYGSYINTFKNQAHIDLLPEKCNGSSDCLQVCPRNVFRMNANKGKVDIVSGGDCIECGACIVQCPRDALRFRYDDGRVVEAVTIRRTRMNMLGRRTVSISTETDE